MISYLTLACSFGGLGLYFGIKGKKLNKER